MYVSITEGNVGYEYWKLRDLRKCVLIFFEELIG